MARTTSLLTALALGAAGLLLSLSATVAPTTANAATAAACSGVTVAPASRTVRRGGQVLLEGRACGASASAGGAEAVQLKIRKGRRWATLASAQASDDGSFSVCASVRVPKHVRIARVQATSTSGATGSTTLRVGARGASSCDAVPAPSNSSTGSSAGQQPGGSSQPPAQEQGNPDCPLAQADSTIGMTLPPSCTVVASDTSANPDPVPFWGSVQAASANRHSHVSSGGDPHATALGTSQGDGAFRRMTVHDGDDFWGERAELGLNNNRSGPTVFYHEGQRRVTFASIRMPSSSPVNINMWRVVLQMKSAQPYNNPAMASIFEMHVRNGRWLVQSNWEDVWSAPAQQNTWTRFAFDITYSADPSKGSIKIYVDLNGDGDADDTNEQSPRVNRATLRAETTAGGASPFQPGESIPSHLRSGIYEDPTYPCPSGCATEIDNFQVVKA